MDSENELELSIELNRYYFLVKLFGNVINAIEKELMDSNQWFTFCPKIGKKFNAHLTSYVFNVTQDLLKLNIDELLVSSELDISAMYSNLRLQFDTYTTFYHLFIHDGDWEEKIIRFRLWQIDSLIIRQQYPNSHLPEVKSQINEERIEIENIIGIINSFDYFNKLSSSQKKRLLKFQGSSPWYCNWKFDSTLLTGKKEKYSWDDLAINTGIKPTVYSDMHSFTSMHVHSSYISILQNEQMSSSDKHAARIVCLRLSGYLTTFFLDDLCDRFSSAKNVAENLNNSEREVIKSYLTSGRVREKRKYFI